MITTVDFPDDLYLELKSCAVLQKTTVKQLLLRGAKSVLEEPVQKPVRRRLKLPLINSGKPGSLKIDNERIYDLIGFP